MDTSQANEFGSKGAAPEDHQEPKTGLMDYAKDRITNLLGLYYYEDSLSDENAEDSTSDKKEGTIMEAVADNKYENIKDEISFSPHKIREDSNCQYEDKNFDMLLNRPSEEEDSTDYLVSESVDTQGHSADLSSENDNQFDVKDTIIEHHNTLSSDVDIEAKDVSCIKTDEVSNTMCESSEQTLDIDKEESDFDTDFAALDTEGAVDNSSDEGLEDIDLEDIDSDTMNVVKEPSECQEATQECEKESEILDLDSKGPCSDEIDKITMENVPPMCAKNESNESSDFVFSENGENASASVAKNGITFESLLDQTEVKSRREGSTLNIDDKPEIPISDPNTNITDSFEVETDTTYDYERLLNRHTPKQRGELPDSTSEAVPIDKKPVVEIFIDEESGEFSENKLETIQAEISHGENDVLPDDGEIMSIVVEREEDESHVIKVKTADALSEDINVINTSDSFRIDNSADDFQELHTVSTNTKLTNSLSAVNIEVTSSDDSMKIEADQEMCDNIFESVGMSIVEGDVKPFTEDKVDIPSTTKESDVLNVFIGNVEGNERVVDNSVSEEKLTDSKERQNINLTCNSSKKTEGDNTEFLKSLKQESGSPSPTAKSKHVFSQKMANDVDEHQGYAVDVTAAAEVHESGKGTNTIAEMTSGEEERELKNLNSASSTKVVHNQETMTNRVKEDKKKTNEDDDDEVTITGISCPNGENKFSTVKPKTVINHHGKSKSMCDGTYVILPTVNRESETQSQLVKKLKRKGRRQQPYRKDLRSQGSDTKVDTYACSFSLELVKRDPGAVTDRCEKDDNIQGEINVTGSFPDENRTERQSRLASGQRGHQRRRKSRKDVKKYHNMKNSYSIDDISYDSDPVAIAEKRECHTNIYNYCNDQDVDGSSELEQPVVVLPSDFVPVGGQQYAYYKVNSLVELLNEQSEGSGDPSESSPTHPCETLELSYCEGAKLDDNRHYNIRVAADSQSSVEHGISFKQSDDVKDEPRSPNGSTMLVLSDREDSPVLVASASFDTPYYQKRTCKASAFTPVAIDSHSIVPPTSDADDLPGCLCNTGKVDTATGNCSHETDCIGMVNLIEKLRHVQSKLSSEYVTLSTREKAKLKRDFASLLLKVSSHYGDSISVCLPVDDVDGQSNLFDVNITNEIQKLQRQRLYARERTRRRRADMSEADKEETRARERERVKKKRAVMSDQEKDVYRARERERARLKRALMTNERKEVERKKSRERMRDFRGAMTDDEKQQRRESSRVRMQVYRQRLYADPLKASEIKKKNRERQRMLRLYRKLNSMEEGDTGCWESNTCNGIKVAVTKDNDSILSNEELPVNNIEPT